jgi:quercetin dioxygenase-like cupin family protein
MPVKESDMKAMGFTTVAALVVASGFALHVALAQMPGLTRTDLQRHDLSIPGREVIQAVVEIAPGVTAPRHSHPGEEIIYVLEGTLVYEVDGQPPAALEAGHVLFVPAGAIHSATNVGTGKAAELATYVVEKGKPLLTPAE